ncbi:MAG: hypothetical protein CMJ31_05205, partial [Phycisphaerae bacterium]|nr:hypothetical protein [Phycisphaerae bacterium]
ALNAPLPATTEGLLAISAFVRSYWWAVGPILLLCAIGLFVALRTNQGADWMGRVMLSVPGVGGVMRSLYSARLARVLGVLLEARVPLVEALDLTEASMGHAAYRDLLAKAQADLVDGESFTSSISRTTLLTPAIIEAIRNGEATARLGSVLTTTAEHLDEDNAQAMRSLSTVIEPLVIVLMGIVIGFVALSMFLPLFDLTSMAGSGGVR